MVRCTNALGILTAAAFAAAASADVILSFTYSDVSGSFDAGSGVYSAVASSDTSGDVTRLDGSPGTAEFDAGFAGMSLADFVMTINVSNNDGFTADGSGSFTVTDTNGDSVSGDLDGVWVKGAFGTVFFNGQLANVTINDNSGDGSFDGATAGSFSTDFSAYNSPFEGAIVTLYIHSASAFLTKSFSGVPALVSAEIVPAPGVLALALASGLVAIRRRR
ncbi:MAG TPA: hypothetical protein PLU35_00385 [Phycisphaerales bacterium]|nr:hypothetical protein [Phycisphaerales bacterium]